MKTSHLGLAVLCIGLLGCVFAEDVHTDLSLSFDGIWAIDVSQSTVDSQFETAPIAKLVANFSRQAGQLVGAIASATGDVDVLVQCSMTGLNSGDFYLLGGSSQDEEFDAGQRIMHFDFLNNTARTFYSSGVWTGTSNQGLLSQPGHYQAIFTDLNLFILNVWTKDGQTLTTVTATKSVVDSEPGWLAKFGTPALFVGAMLISRLLKSWMAPSTATSGDAARPEGGAKATAATKSKKD